MISDKKAPAFSVSERGLKNTLICRVFYLLYFFMMVAAASFVFLDFFAQITILYGIIFFCMAILIILTSCFVFLKSNATISYTRAICLVIIGGVLLRVLAMVLFRSEPISDFYTPFAFYRFYQERGPYMQKASWAQQDVYQSYYSMFPAWFSHMRIIMLIYDLLGENLNYIRALNLFLAAGTILLVYCSIAEKRTALLAALLFSVNPVMVLYSCTPSPEHFAAFLFVAVIFAWSKVERSRGDGAWHQNRRLLLYCLLMILCCVLINWFKPLSVLFPIAFFCFEFVAHVLPELLKKRPWHELWHKTVSFEVAFLAVCLLSLFLGNALLQARVENFMKTDVVDSTGLYLLWAYATTESGAYDSESADEIVAEIMSRHSDDRDAAFQEIESTAREQFVRNLPYLPQTLGIKFFKIFGRDAEIFSCTNTGTSFSWPDTITFFGKQFDYFSKASSSISEDYPAQVATVLQIPFLSLMAVSMRILYLLTAWYALNEVRQRGVHYQPLQMMIIIFGYTLVLLIGGAQGRYKSLAIPLWCMLAAYALSRICLVSGSNSSEAESNA